jgi:hypothetical protein
MELFCFRRDWARVEEDSRKALALDDALVKVTTIPLFFNCYHLTAINW